MMRGEYINIIFLLFLSISCFKSEKNKYIYIYIYVRLWETKRTNLLRGDGME